jgi:hypothetical protein
MNSFSADAAFVLLCLAVMVAIWAIIVLMSFARGEWPAAKEKEVDKVQHDRLHQRLEQITNQTVQPKRVA